MAGCPAVRQPELSQQPVRPGTAMCRWTRRTEPPCGGGGCREWTWALVRGRTWCDGGGRLSCVSAEEGPGPAGLVVLVRCDWAPCSARSTAAVRRDGRSRASRLADAGRRRRGARPGWGRLVAIPRGATSPRSASAAAGTGRSPTGHELPRRSSICDIRGRRPGRGRRTPECVWPRKCDAPPSQSACINLSGMHLGVVAGGGITDR